MSPLCVRFADIIEVPASPDPDTQRAYLHERLRAVTLEAAQWARPVRVLVRGFTAGEAARALAPVEPLTGVALDVEVHYEDTATVRPHRMRAYAPKSRRSPNIRLECVLCGARAEVANLPDKEVPLMGADGVLQVVSVLSDPIEPFDPHRHATIEAEGQVVWPGPEVTA